MKNINLGPLEQEVMYFVWKTKSCTTREVVEDLGKNRDIAYNTIQTVMTRLVDKGLLKRTLKGKAYIYVPISKKRSMLQAVMARTFHSLRSQFGEEALIAFVDGLDDISESTRQKLIKKLQKK